LPLIVIVIFACVLLDEFEAVTVYTDCALAAEGVPEMTPVVGERLRPAGSAGLTLYEVAVPVIVGLRGVIATPNA
jgi:hypothetical protein